MFIAWSRIISSIVLWFIWGTIGLFYNTAATVITGKIAGNQFENSDVAYITTQATFSLFSGVGGLITIGFLLAFIALWIGPIKRAIKTVATDFIILFVASTFALTVIVPQQAFGYAETTDKAEAYTIMPNESAFWIPDVGANKTDQSRLDSEDYLNANKIAAKRFVIPHAKFQNSGGWAGWDLYVPTGRLFIQDRTTFSHEWVDETDRGTSSKKEGFPCQSKEGLNVTVGISIGANVKEENAAKFLYNFGVVQPTGDRKDPQVIFTSVYYGRSVANVMNDIGRKKVQGLICSEISKRTFDQVNDQANAMMENVRKDAIAYFDSVGITIQFIGYADTFTFDPEVQKAVNQKYIATTLGPQLQTLAAIAQLQVQEGLSKGLTNHGLPIVITPDVINTLSKIGQTAPNQPNAVVKEK